jgi:hypothetical protein
VDDWICILNLADKWDFNEVKELAVRELQKKRELDIVTKIALYGYQKYAVDKRHLVPLYAALCKRDFPLSLEEGQTIGMEATVLVNTVRERLRANHSAGRSPLPKGLEEADVFRVIETQFRQADAAVERKGNPRLWKFPVPLKSQGEETQTRTRGVRFSDHGPF